MSKLEVTGAVLVKSYEVFARAVEEGIAHGWNRAHKHTATPSPDHIKEQIESEVISAVCEYFNFYEYDR